MIFPSLIRIVENRISRRTRNDDRDNGREKRGRGGRKMEKNGTNGGWNVSNDKRRDMIRAA